MTVLLLKIWRHYYYMTRLVPEELSDNTYWDISTKAQESIWVEIIAHGLGVSVQEARRRIKELREHPLEKRLREAGLFLAEVSDGFIPYDRDGHRMDYRGHKPVLATKDNILKIGGAKKTQRSQWKRVFSRTYEENFLLEEELTAANPDDWSDTGIEFSWHDINRGVYISPEIDNETASALGIAQADGTLVGYRLQLTGREEDLEFYKQVVPEVFSRAFNLVQEQPESQDKVSTDLGLTYRYRQHRFSYNSKALSTYLQMLGFPTNREESRTKRVPARVRKASNGVKEHFVSHYVVARAHKLNYPGESSYVGINSESETELQDIKKILLDVFHLPGTLSIRDTTGYKTPRQSRLLYIGPEAVDEMVKQRVFEHNPYLRKELISALD